MSIYLITGATGFVDKRLINALFVAVLELLENPKLRCKIARIGGKMVLEEFIQERITSETISVLDEISK